MAFDREIAAMTVFCEADSASPEERRAIAFVMFNRLRAGRYGKTIAEVCLTAYQFSEWNDDKGDNANLRRGARVAESDALLKDCITAFDEAHSGANLDPTQGATHYHDKSIAPPKWTVGAECILVTPKFYFYRNVK